VKLPKPFRRSAKPSGLYVPRGQISHQGDGLADRLRALGVPVHDPLGDAYRAGTFGSTPSGGGQPPDHVVAGDELPPGAKIVKAESIAPKFQDGGDGGTVWSG
jgi:hypothetical protein